MERKRTIIQVLINIGAFAIPLLVGFFCIPHIIKGIGIVQFGFLSVAWVIVGYFSIFDLGLGRALTQAVASDIGSKQFDRIWPSIKKTIGAMAVLSLIGALTLAAVASFTITDILKTPANLHQPFSDCMYILSVGVPAVVLFSGLKGIIEAFGRFDHSSIARAGLGLWTFVSPLLILVYTPDIRYVILALVIGRYVTVFYIATIAWAELRKAGFLQSRADVSLSHILRFGGWMTVSNIVSPMMVYMDRFFVSSIAGLQAVAFYTTPSDLVSRISFIPDAILGVMFPALTKEHAKGGKRLVELYDVTLKSVSFIMFGVCSGIVCFTPIFLDVWLGHTFATNSSMVMSVLTIGLYLNSVARSPFNLLQAMGRADLTAKIHLAELPLFVLSLAMLLHVMGIVGAAVAWLGRVALDLGLLALFAHKEVSQKKELNNRIVVALLGAILLSILAFVPNIWVRVTMTVVLDLAAAGLFWRALDEDTRGRISVAITHAASKVLPRM